MQRPLNGPKAVSHAPTQSLLLITRATRKQFVQVCPDAAPLVLLGLKRSPASSTLRRANPEETLWEMLPPLAKIACLCQLVGGTHRTGTSYVQMGQLLPRQELLRRLALRTPTEHYPSTVLRAAQAPQARQSSSTPHLLMKGCAVSCRARMSILEGQGCLSWTRQQAQS